MTPSIAVTIGGAFETFPEIGMSPALGLAVETAAL